MQFLIVASAKSKKITFVKNRPQDTLETYGTKQLLKVWFFS